MFKKIITLLFTTSLIMFVSTNVFANTRVFVGVCPKCGGTLHKNVKRVKTGNYEYRNGVKYLEYGVTVTLQCGQCPYQDTTVYSEFVAE